MRLGRLRSSEVKGEPRTTRRASGCLGEAQLTARMLRSRERRGVYHGRPQAPLPQSAPHFAMAFSEFVMKYWPLCSAAVVLALLLLGTYAWEFRFGPPLVSPAELTRMFNRDKAIILDVRSEADYATAHLPGAVCVGASPEVKRLQALLRDKSRPVVLYAADDAPSLAQCQAILSTKPEGVFRLRGGLRAWQTEGLPVAVGQQA